MSNKHEISRPIQFVVRLVNLIHDGRVLWRNHGLDLYLLHRFVVGLDCFWLWYQGQDCFLVEFALFELNRHFYFFGQDDVVIQPHMLILLGNLIVLKVFQLLQFVLRQDSVKDVQMFFLNDILLLFLAYFLLNSLYLFSLDNLIDNDRFIRNLYIIVLL